MRKALTCLSASLFLAQPLVAQERQVEIGTALGASVVFNGDAEVFIGLPGAGGFLAAPTFFVTIFASPAFMVEPQLGFEWNSISEQVTFNGFLQLAYLLTPDATGSAYVAVNGGYATIGSNTNSGAIGAGFGYRLGVTDAVIVRFEARYRRWLADAFDFNEITGVIALGVGFP